MLGTFWNLGATMDCNYYLHWTNSIFSGYRTAKLWCSNNQLVKRDTPSILMNFYLSSIIKLLPSLDIVDTLTFSKVPSGMVQITSDQRSWEQSSFLNYSWPPNLLKIGFRLPIQTIQYHYGPEFIRTIFFYQKLEPAISLASLSLVIE